MLRSRSGRSSFQAALLVILVICTCSVAAFGSEKIKRRKPTPSPTAAGDLTSIPLPIGHEAKGLVLPNYDADGHLVGRLEAGTAKRIDQNHVLFSGLKLTTYTVENQTDLVVEMIDSILDLKTRFVTSQHRATIKRADFNIAGDRLEFDTVGRRGTMFGNVKMVITAKPPPPSASKPPDE